jgi:(p)ppGpp synthase/HD superfamily hydrolase
MHAYAQTNLQLFDQLSRDGYSQAELGCILKAYDLAACLLTARFQHSGKPTISHFVGTASILSSLHVSAKVVVAGLLHNVYEIGDFGDGCKGISGPKRAQVRRAVGSEVEEYAARYTTMRWNKRTIPTFARALRGWMRLIAMWF